MVNATIAALLKAFMLLVIVHYVVKWIPRIVELVNNRLTMRKQVSAVLASLREQQLQPSYSQETQSLVAETTSQSHSSSGPSSDPHSVVDLARTKQPNKPRIRAPKAHSSASVRQQEVPPLVSHDQSQGSRETVACQQPTLIPSMPPLTYGNRDFREAASLRRQQDEEYENALEEDLMRCAVEESLAEDAAQEERALLALEDSIPPEPGCEDEDVVRVAFRFDEQPRVVRRFRSTDTVGGVLSFVQVKTRTLTISGKLDVRVAGTNRRLPLDNSGLSLHALGLVTSAVILVRLIK